MTTAKKPAASDTATAAAKAETARVDAFNSAVAAAGWTGAVLNSFPELKKIFQNATKQKWTADRFAQEVRKSKWFQARTDTQRQFDILEKNDPKTFAQNVGRAQADIIAKASAIGIPISRDRALQIARLSMRNGFDDTQLQQTLGAELHYDPSQMYGGQVGSAMGKIKSIASQYMIKLGDSAQAQWASQIAAGTADETKFQQWAVNQAKAKFSHLGEQLDAGLTLQQIADPYKQAMADTLEMDASSISDNDATVQQALSYRGSDSNGALGLMPHYEFTRKLRDDPRWLNTDNAKSSLLGTMNKLAAMFGKVAS